MGKEFLGNLMNGNTSLCFLPHILATTVFRGQKDSRDERPGTIKGNRNNSGRYEDGFCLKRATKHKTNQIEVSPFTV